MGRWHFGDLHDELPERFETAPLEHAGREGTISVDWWRGVEEATERRLYLLEDALPAMNQIVTRRILEESQGLSALACVEALEREMGTPELLLHSRENQHESWLLAAIRAAEASGYPVILWDDDLFHVGKIPGSFVEVWWSRRWKGLDGADYEVCLERDQRYGWFCYGHEL